MALRDLLYRCPSCGHDPTAGEGGRVRCPGCGARYARGSGARVRVDGSERWSGEVDAAVLSRRIGELGGPLDAARGPGGGFRYEAETEMTRVVGERPVRDRGRLLGWAERPGSPVPGRVTLTSEALRFRPRGGEGEERLSVDDLRCVQTASSSVQLRFAGDRVVQLRFPDDSPLRWELLLRAVVRERRERAGRPPPAEFQPRITAGGETDGEAAGDRLRRGFAREGWSPPRRGVFYRAVRLLLRAVTRLALPTRVTGASNVPPEGPFVLAVNHQSILDPVFVQAACPRPVHAMTKSTQFAGALWRALLVRLLAYPTRRYRVDPQAVRTSLRLLAAGRGVGIFPEGERSWDGRVQPFRPGSVRLMRASGAPVIPCRVSGSYDVLPRWGRRIRPGPVEVRFGPPAELGGSLRDAAEGLRRAVDGLRAGRGGGGDR